MTDDARAQVILGAALVASGGGSTCEAAMRTIFDISRDSMDQFARAHLTSVNVDGDRATTTDSSGGDATHWKKVNGRWLFDVSPSDSDDATAGIESSPSDDGTTGGATNTGENTNTTPSGNGGTAPLANQCSSGVSTSHAITCELAGNVFYEYYRAVQRGGDTTGLSVWSPATKQYYTANCSKSADVTSCRLSGTTEPDAEVQITQAAFDAYTSENAHDYAQNHDLGPRG